MALLTVWTTLLIDADLGPSPSLLVFLMFAVVTGLHDMDEYIQAQLILAVRIASTLRLVFFLTRELNPHMPPG